MKILSLFDGMSCGQQAITNLGIKDYTYYSSEIDKWAIQVTQKNFPNTIQIGDIKGIHIEDGYFFYNQNNNPMENGGSYKSDIDIILGGSPCQGFSFAGKQLNFQDPRSALFFEYVRILKEVKPKYFLLENVKMKKEYQDIISEHLFGIQPTIINSSLLTAQNRVRLYWVGELQKDGTYKQVNIEQPQDKGILLKDILENEVDDKYFLNEKNLKHYERDFGSKGKILEDLKSKSPTLISAMGTGGGNIPCIVNNKIRKLTPIECERLQGVKDNFTASVSNSQRYKMLGNGWTVPVIEHILKYIIK